MKIFTERFILTKRSNGRTPESLMSLSWDRGITAAGRFVTANGGLSFTQPRVPGGFNEYVSDPMRPVPYTQKITQNYPREFMTEDQRFAATRPDVLVYQTEPLAADLTVAGDIKP